MNVRKIAYWVTTGFLAFTMLYGGIAEIVELFSGPELSAIGIATVVDVLGYPLYFLYITGIAKILAGVAILVPGFERLKEWAYAGIVFNMSGASISWLVVTVIGGAPIPEGYGSGMFHTLNALFFVGLAFVSWALRPESRVLGSIFPFQQTPKNVNSADYEKVGTTA